MRFFEILRNLGRAEYRANPLENPAVPLSSPAVWEWLMGGEPTASGESVNETNALQITTVYDCVRILAESVASLPLEVWERGADGGRTKAIEAQAYKLLAIEPNPEMSAYSFKQTFVGCLALTGNTYAQIERNGAGQPIALWPLNPLKTRPIRLPSNRIAYETSDGMEAGLSRLIDPEDMLHVLLFSLDGIHGLSPIQQARQSLGLTKATEKYGARFFGNGSRPGGVVMSKGPKPDDKTKREIIESWNNSHGGVNQGKTAFLFGAEWDYKQISLSPEDSQFLATRQFQRTEIAALWRIPPHMIGDTSRMSGNNVEQQNLQFVIDTLRPYLASIENEVERKLMPTVGRNAGRFFVKFDVSERLRGDFKTQQEGFAAGVQWGWFSANDVRAKLGENPGPPELNVYRTPVNMQSAKTLLLSPAPAGSPAPPAPELVPPEPDEPAPLPAPSAPRALPAPEPKALPPYAAFALPFRDAFGRLSRRAERDSAAFRVTLGPVLRGLADLGVSYRGGSRPEIAAGLVAEGLKAMEKRAAKWPAAIAEGDLETLTAGEFWKVVRFMHINAAKEISAAQAASEVRDE